MNVFEMLAFMLLSAILLGLGWLLSLRWGTRGFLITAVPVAMFWAVVVFFSFRRLTQESRWSWTPRPRCRNNKCGRRQYVLVEATAERAVFRCKCGDHYLSKDGHFSQILKDGSRLPYMVRDVLGNWKAEERGGPREMTVNKSLKIRGPGRVNESNLISTTILCATNCNS